MGVVRALQSTFMKTKETFTAVIKEIPDRTNPFVMTMPEQISKIHSDVEDLVAMQTKAKVDYVKMLDWMNMEAKTKADDFCMWISSWCPNRCSWPSTVQQEAKSSSRASVRIRHSTSPNCKSSGA